MANIEDVVEANIATLSGGCSNLRRDVGKAFAIALAVRDWSIDPSKTNKTRHGVHSWCGGVDTVTGFASCARHPSLTRGRARAQECSTRGRTAGQRRDVVRDDMGKRKSSKPPPKKVVPKVDTQFTCPFCNHDKSVVARLDHVAEKGLVECNVCAQKYTCNITHLSEPIDVYSDWIDACERINAKEDDEDED